MGGEGAATEPALGALRTGQDSRREKMDNRYAAIVYIRLNASMTKQKPNPTHCIYAKTLIVHAAIRLLLEYVLNN